MISLSIQAVQNLVFTRTGSTGQLKEIGINVNLNTVSYETLLDMRDSGQYDLLIWNVLVANTGDGELFRELGTANLQTTQQDTTIRK